VSGVRSKRLSADLKGPLGARNNGRDVEARLQVTQRGFISSTLGQGATGRIRGTWAINGRIITLKVSDAEDVRFSSGTITGTIESFKPKELVVKNERGDTSTFGRVL
jgi:hypothetical protein